MVARKERRLIELLSEYAAAAERAAKARYERRWRREWRRREPRAFARYITLKKIVRELRSVRRTR